MSSRETKISSEQYKVRREGDVLVIENVATDLNDPELFLDAFNEAVEKKGQAIVVHFPSPKTVTSVVISALGEASRLAGEADLSFCVVVHPKIRLLIRMFGLEDRVPTVDRLQTALEQAGSAEA